METAKIFENGKSQAVRLPKEFRFKGKEVNINKIGNVVVLFSKEDKWDSLFKSLDLFSKDFMKEGREQGSKQKREKL